MGTYVEKLEPDCARAPLMCVRMQRSDRVRLRALCARARPSGVVTVTPLSMHAECGLLCSGRPRAI